MNLSFAVVFVATLVLPSFAMMVWSTSSMAVGVVAAAFLWILRAIALRKAKPYQATSRMVLLWLSAFVAVVIVHTAISVAVTSNPIDVRRTISSLAIVAWLTLCADSVSRQVAFVSARHLDRAIKLAFALLTVIAAATALGLLTVGSARFEKAVGPFTETSHFALAYAPLLLYAAATVGRGWKRYLIIGVAMGLAVALQNLTLMAVAVLVLFIVLYGVRLVAAAALAGVGALFLSLQYFVNRLNFSSGATNLSSLVYLSGWQRAWLNLVDTHGVGVGFQQFGVVGRIDTFGLLIRQIMGTDLNLFDGGSTASKLIGEFGIVGILLLVVFLRAFYRSSRFIHQRAARRTWNREEKWLLFWHSCVVMYAIELFVRGVGYFSPTGFLFLAALVSLRQLSYARAAVYAPVDLAYSPQRS